MTYGELRTAVRRQPFAPFVLRMAGGREIRVRSPEFIFVPPETSRTFIVYEDKAHDLIDLLLVESIEFKNGRTGRRRAR